MNIKNICIYCAASSRINRIYFDDAERLGDLLGQRGLHVINGAGNIGLMRVVTDAVLAAGGQVTGVIPAFMVKRGLCHQNLTTVIETQTMHERKQVIADLSDVVIALPGGFGTMEELLEMITWRQLGLYHIPIIILNTNRFYDPLLEMLSRTVEEKFAHDEHAALWQVAESPEEVVGLLEDIPQPPSKGELATSYRLPTTDYQLRSKGEF